MNIICESNYKKLLMIKHVKFVRVFERYVGPTCNRGLS